MQTGGIEENHENVSQYIWSLVEHCDRHITATPVQSICFLKMRSRWKIYAENIIPFNAHFKYHHCQLNNLKLFFVCNLWCTYYSFCFVFEVCPFRFQPQSVFCKDFPKFSSISARKICNKALRKASECA